MSCCFLSNIWSLNDFIVGFEPRWSSDYIPEKKEWIDLVVSSRSALISWSWWIFILFCKVQGKDIFFIFSSSSNIYFREDTAKVPMFTLHLPTYWILINVKTQSIIFYYIFIYIVNLAKSLDENFCQLYYWNIWRTASQTEWQWTSICLMINQVTGYSADELSQNNGIAFGWRTPKLNSNPFQPF